MALCICRREETNHCEEFYSTTLFLFLFFLFIDDLSTTNLLNCGDLIYIDRKCYFIEWNVPG